MRNPTEIEAAKIIAFSARVELTRAEYELFLAELKEKYNELDIKTSDLSVEELKKYKSLQIPLDKAVAEGKLYGARLRRECGVPHFSRMSPSGFWVHPETGERIVTVEVITEVEKEAEVN